MIGAIRSSRAWGLIRIEGNDRCLQSHVGPANCAAMTATANGYPPVGTKILNTNGSEPGVILNGLGFDLETQAGTDRWLCLFLAIRYPTTHGSESITME